MTHCSLQEWLHRHSGEVLHVNNGRTGLAGVRIGEMTFLTPYRASGLSEEAALAASVQAATLYQANLPRSNGE